MKQIPKLLVISAVIGFSMTHFSPEVHAMNRLFKAASESKEGKMVIFDRILTDTTSPSQHAGALGEITQIFSGNHLGVAVSKRDISRETITKLHDRSMAIVANRTSTPFQLEAHEVALFTAWDKLPAAIKNDELTVKFNNAIQAVQAKKGGGLTQAYVSSMKTGFGDSRTSLASMNEASLAGHKNSLDIGANNPAFGKVENPAFGKQLPRKVSLEDVGSPRKNVSQSDSLLAE